MRNTHNYSKYFSDIELMCYQTHSIVLARGFIQKLDELRIKYDKPMLVNSCCRSKAYNEKIKGNPESFHIYDTERHGFTGTCAVDIGISNLTDKGNLMKLAWELGWSIGFNRSFLHLDRRIDYTNLKQIVFTY